MAIDLTKLEKKFIDLFANVTQEEFEQWLLTKTKPMAQQTAVEWLREQYVHITWMVNRDELPTDNVFEFMLNRFEQAKQMEREQIIAACNQTDVIGLDNEQPGEQYYTQTYGNNQNK